MQFAHTIAGDFPEGSLYLNLRGHPHASAMRQEEALGRLLASLGVPTEEIPQDEQAAGALYRTRLAGRRMLVLLDDAESAAQIRPLLPAAGGCLVLVTSRNRLAGLIVSHGVRPVALAALPAEEANALLGDVLGHVRVAAEPQATVRVAQLCAYVPLALCVAAANLACHPLWTIEQLAVALEADLLGTLELDGEAAVRAAFRLSYIRLDDDARRLFRLLGLSPGPDVTAEAAAALDRFADALDAVRQALELAREADYRMWEGDAVTALAEIHAARGDEEDAVRYAHEAYAIHQETGYWLGRQRLIRWLPIS